MRKMRGLLRAISSLKFKQSFLFIQKKPFCNKPSKEIAHVDKNGDGSNSLSKYDAYKEVQNLDFMKAAKILFSDPPKKKKFGLDFHLVQLFFVCLPSLAVYLVAQYARSEMRRMDAELELKKRAEEAQAKEIELKAAEEAEAPKTDLLEVKARLEKLEETIKDIVVESKKQSSSLEDKSKLENSKQDPPPTKPNNSIDNKHSSDASTSKTSIKEGNDASTRDLDSGSNGSSPKKI